MELFNCKNYKRVLQNTRLNTLIVLSHEILIKVINKIIIKICLFNFYTKFV